MMKNIPVDFEKAAAEFQRDSAAALRHREALARQNALRNEGRARFRDWPAVRAAAAGIRDADIRQLENRLVDFAARFERAGGKIHWAPSAADARAALAGIASASGAKTAVRAHSSTLDEIEADKAFAETGVDLKPSSAGDFINKLRGEDGSAHFCAPAMNLSREEVGPTLRKGLGAAATNVPEEQVESILRAIRPLVLDADMGVVGANFLLADEGKVVLVDNEGNLRLTAAMPRVLVVVAGIDKATSGTGNLAILLESLAASAGGRFLTPSVTILGPDAKRACGEKTEMHLVLVDNGRTRMLADPASAESLRCVKCGACADVCPVFSLGGGLAYRTPIPGPIGAVLSPHLMPGLKRENLSLATPLCGACTDVCPVGIDLHRALVANRNTIAFRHVGRKVRILLALHRDMMSSPFKYTLGTKLMRALLFFADITHGTPFNPLSAWSKYRTLPEPPARTFRSWYKTHQPESPRAVVRGNTPAPFPGGTKTQPPFPGNKTKPPIPVKNATGAPFPEKKTDNPFPKAK